MARLYVIEERDRQGVGLARSGLCRTEADRLCALLAACYPSKSYSVQPQRMVGRGRQRRVEYPTP